MIEHFITLLYITKSYLIKNCLYPFLQWWQVIFILICLYCRNPKILQKDLLFSFCKILSSGREQLITSLLHTSLCRQYLHSPSSCTFQCAYVGVEHAGAMLESRPRHTSSQTGVGKSFSTQKTPCRFVFWAFPLLESVVEGSYFKWIMLRKVNKMSCPNICASVTASGAEEDSSKDALWAQLLSMTDSVAPSGSWTPLFLVSVLWSIPFQPFLTISWALEELSLGLVIPDTAGPVLSS